MSMTLHQLVNDIRRRLGQLPGISAEQVSAEARLMVEEVLRLPWQTLYREPEYPLAPEPVAAVEHVLACRVEKRIPIQYLLHSADFYGLRLYVNPHVLIPRPETELLAEEALRVIENRSGEVSILDLCTGSGAIAVAVAKTLQNKGITGFRIAATDLSSDALRVARMNARMHGCDIEFLWGDLLEPVGNHRFDLILCNPPYVDPALKSTLSPEVLEHEPCMALFPPSGDAFQFYRRLASASPAHLAPGGILLAELGQGMDREVEAAFKKESLCPVRMIRDYAGIPRVAVVTV